MVAPVALVRCPGPKLADGIVTHHPRVPIDSPRAMEQWEAYGAALRRSGWDLREVSPADGCPDAVFVEDTVVMWGDLAVLARPGVEARRAEVAAVDAVVTGLGCSVRRIVSPGTLDGGDVLKVGDTVYAGCGGRTNEAGIEQLRSLLEPHHVTIVAVPVQKVLHLKSAVTALPDGSIVGYPPLVDDLAVFPRFVAVPEESGAHVVLLGGDRLLMAADCPRSADLFEGLGYEPVPVDISEYQKLEGCVTCLSVRLRHHAA